MRLLDLVRSPGALALVFSAALVACGGPLKYAPKGTPRAPECDANIVADVNKDSSTTRLEIKAEHLAPPGRLQEGGTTYVVWARKPDAQWQRIGAIKYDEGGRTGDIAGVSVPFTSFELIISIEKKADPEAPSGDVVISQKVGD
ncbi:MAG: hypothetical protein U0359_10910 [Byssovorax sp.]